MAASPVVVFVTVLVLAAGEAPAVVVVCMFVVHSLSE
jgi:hypothetical protein